MLLIKERIEGLTALGAWLRAGLDEISQGKENALSKIVTRAGYENGWFTSETVLQSLGSITGWLDEKVLVKWAESYYLSEPVQSKKIAVIMAGNIPLVNFHDFLSVLITGHRFLGKLSSQDKVLLPFIAGKLVESNPYWKDHIEFTEERLTKFDAVIATGSMNTSRYFEYYFGKYPHIIRKNRHSLAILNGNESNADTKGLYNDIFQYYGMGCRNVSMLIIPKGYDLPSLFRSWEQEKHPVDQHKYQNNYDYYRSLYMVNQSPFFDTGYASFVPSDQLASPVSVVHYFEYADNEDINAYVRVNHSQIQCIVSNIKEMEFSTIPFGTAQCPLITDYPDGVDIIQFLLAL
jgi:hypothetical protein